ncbi:FadR/GntR family transcriptional regulator [Noviherbaspirillum sp. CPCC 100848]|uniref:FadR/GntR family transcriptional regulator n=1 Tax=Noviherbaspirillum album TaxID=3080276 RepID=A0ABU6J8L5_9BURK|nr:FadR/GntR family transcriptional regulator [Noviherbaspirillum sp. CPCC 100848]MEC4719993.1 FadR/GntR family transcriptional regulator [Noviherbaspirillum sp. CPCC 100848]
MSDNPLFQVAPLEAAAKMPERITKILQDLILKGTYPPKSRLPSEGEMAQHFGVSRTVMREAVSRLKAEGLVESRQGSGVFVREAGPDRPFRIKPSVIDSVQEVLQVAELRRGMEAEIAALAAERASDEQIAEIGARLAAIDGDVAAGGDGVAADIEFHRSIARATGNPHFLALWDYLGQFLKGTIKLTRTWEAQSDETRQQVLDEHQAVYDAILRRDANAAREAARKHMEMSSHRIRNIDPDFVAVKATKPMRRRAAGAKPLSGGASENL